MNLRTLIIILLASMFFSCEKDQGDKIWANYNETQCANAWDNINATDTEARVKQYLESKDIKLFGIIIETYSYGPFCTACFCPSGRIIRVLISESDLREIQRLGFKI